VRESIDKLVLIGAEIIVMPANSPHYAVSSSVAFSPVPFVDIIETTVATCVERAYSRASL
jgi:aspartate/glutamate racemase